MRDIVADNPGLVVAGVAVIVLIPVIAAFVGARHGRGTRAMLWTGLGVWLLVIAVATLGSTVRPELRGEAGLNLVAFQEIDRGLTSVRSSAGANLLGNVALFFPLGVLIACLARAHFISRVAAAFTFGMALSVSIEIAQYVLGRVADIDDVILNGAGALAGGIVGALVASIVVSTRRPR